MSIEGGHELGVTFRSEIDQGILEQTAEVVGKYGFDVIGVYEDLGDPAPFYPLMTFAMNSRSARVGPVCVVVPKYKTMEPIVGEIARLDKVASQNVFMGLASGAWMDRVGLQPAGVQQMREAIEVSQYLLEGIKEGYKGEHFNVSPGFGVNYDLPGRVPILIGAWGEKIVSLAGEIADEVKVGGSANPLMTEIIRSRLKPGTSVVGRVPDDVGIVLGAVTVIDEDRNVAMAIAKNKAAVYIEAIGHLDPTVERDFSEEIVAIGKAVRAGDVEGAARMMSDNLARRFVMAGNPKDIIGQVEKIFEAGAKRFDFGTPHGVSEMEGIRLLGEEVLPYFQ